jgi:two-component system CitB family sensor kinase
VARVHRRPGPEIAEGPGPAELRLRVSNSGPRITEPERIFERGWSTKMMDAAGPVFGLNGSPDGVGKGGHGLGLALVRQAVERNCGSVSLHRDDRLDETVFEVRLPLPETVREVSV